jgi:hypothetical protein
MGQVIHGKLNRYSYLVPRSGSHSIVASWLQQYEQENFALWQERGFHPARYLREQLTEFQIPESVDLAVVVRNPVERFRSMVARHGTDVESQLIAPIYGPIDKLPFTHYFRFEDQIQEYAEWLGINTPIPVLAESDENNKPILTPEQELRVREIYQNDIALWQSLQAS